jgi:aromatic-L-amino-acid decarboxylase
MDIDEVEFSNMVETTMQRVRSHLRNLSDSPAFGSQQVDAFVRDLRSESTPPEGPVSLDSQLQLLFDECMPRSLATNHPGYFGYIPGGGVLTAAIADLIQNSTNRVRPSR